MRYQLGTSSMRNYDDEEDLIQYNLHENSIKDSDVMQYAYRINFANNNSENDKLISYKYQIYARKYEIDRRDDQTLMQSSISSTEIGGKKNFMSREIHENLKRIKDDNDSTSYDFFKNFDRHNIVPEKLCDNFICIRLCCPFGNRLLNGKCIVEEDNFIFLDNMYGYINNSLQNKSKRVDELFLLIVHDPCQKIGHYLLSSQQNMFLVNGSVYLPYYNSIIEPTSYCLATVDYNIFAVNVCFDIMKKIMNKVIKYNKNTIDPQFIFENWKPTKGKNDSTSHDLVQSSNKVYNKNNIVPDKMCDNITCIRLCCPFGNRLVNGKCITGHGNFVFLPSMSGFFNDSLRKENKSIDNLFLVVVHDPCRKTKHDQLPFSEKNVFFIDGSLYLQSHDITLKSTSYCLASVAPYKFIVNICFEIKNVIINKNKNVYVPIPTRTIVSICGFLGTLLFALVMFIVYSIVPELRNIHSFILRGYSGSIVIMNTVELLKIFIERDAIPIENFTCIAYAFVKYYFYLARWFWLSIMSIDIWRIFRKLRSLQRDVKQQERKKLIMYSACGWGGPFIFAIICGIIYSVPGVSENFQPRFGEECWLSSYPYLFYYLGVVIICIIVIISLCICTARKIAHYEKDIAHYLKDSESRCYKDNKQWFGLYLEAIKVLFIIICVKHFMYATQSFCEEWTPSLRYMYAALEVIEQFCIFIIFVWKKKIRQLLLKRFNCQNHGLFSIGQRISTSLSSCINTTETTSL
ncbi:hypothetical protein ACFW04_000043 [Cataglyphis niger]